MNAAAPPAPDLLAALEARTTALLTYAGVVLKEICDYGRFGGDEYDRAHQESFLLLLFAAPAAFLQELNVYYGVNLAHEGVSPGAIRDAVAVTGRSCAETAALYKLEKDATSWFSQAKSMRDFGAHIAGVPRTFHVGGASHGEVHLQDPRTKQAIPRHFPDLFADWLAEMQKLLAALRATARAANGL